MAPDRLVDHTLAGLRERDELAAAVVRIGTALDEAGALETVESIGRQK